MCRWAGRGRGREDLLGGKSHPGSGSSWFSWLSVKLLTVSQLLFCFFHWNHFDNLGNCAPPPLGYLRKVLRMGWWLGHLACRNKPQTPRFSWKQGLSFLSSLFSALELIPGRILSYLFYMLPCYIFFQLLESHLIESKGSELKSQLYHLLTCNHRSPWDASGQHIQEPNMVSLQRWWVEITWLCCLVIRREGFLWWNPHVWLQSRDEL